MMSPLTSLINIVLEILTRATREEKEIRASKPGNGKSKPSVFAGDMMESTKHTIKMLLGLINKFSEVIAN